MKHLTREEMKKVLGGSGVTCTYSLTPGHHAQGGTCSGTVTQCQAAADAWCWAHDECVDVDCRAADQS